MGGDVKPLPANREDPEPTDAGRLVKGSAATKRIRQAIEAFPREISYVVAEAGDIGPFASPGQLAEEGLWFRGEDLLSLPEWLGSLVCQSGSALGTEDLQISASLFLQGYAYRILMVAVACLTTSGVVPDSSAERTAIAISKGRPRVVGYFDPAAFLLDQERSVAALLPSQSRSAIDFLVESAIEAHIAPLVSSIRRSVRVGARLLWGNVASSAATAFRTMDGCLGPTVRQLAEAFFERAPAELRGLGAFLSLEQGGRSGWFWERNNCCLFDRLPGRIRCSDCSLTTTSSRRAAYLDSLRSQ